MAGGSRSSVDEEATPSFSLSLLPPPPPPPLTPSFSCLSVHVGIARLPPAGHYAACKIIGAGMLSVF